MGEWFDINGLWVFFFLLALACLATVILLLAMARPLLRRIEDTNSALVERFKRFGFLDRLLARRVFMMGAYDGVHMVAHWYLEKYGLHGVPMLVVHAKVPHTSHVKMHAATTSHRMFEGVASLERLAGWRKYGLFMIAQGHEADTEGERKVLQRLSGLTVEHLNDTTAFPYGVALRTGYFTMLYGGAVALALAGGDEERAISMDVEVTVPFSMSDAVCEHLLQNMAKAARDIAHDVHM